MYVDGVLKSDKGLTQRVSGPPTMMFTATAPVPGLHRVQTLEPKVTGDLVYVLGETKNELGASALYGMLGQTGLNVPKTDFSASAALCGAVAKALDDQLLASCCVVSRGGLANAFARMVMAGEMGWNLIWINLFVVKT